MISAVFLRILKAAISRLRISERMPVPYGYHNAARGSSYIGTYGRNHSVGDMELMSEISDKIKAIVVEHLGVEEAKVTPEASFIDDLGADSLDTVELVMAFEEAFNVEIPEDAAEKIATVKDAIDYIEKQSEVG